MKKLQKLGYVYLYISLAITILLMSVNVSFAQWSDEKEAQINTAVKRAERIAKNLPDNEKKIEWFVLARINKMIKNNAKFDPDVKRHYSSKILFSDDSGRLYVDVALLLSASRSDTFRVKNKIKEVDGKIKLISNPQFQYPIEIYCWIPYYAIKEIAKLPQVGNISAVGVPMWHTGSVTSIGDTQLRAQEARDYFNCDGSQIKVGVISEGAKHWHYSRDSGGDLPEAIDFVTSEDIPGDEGTAMMEIIYDMAPGAQLVFGGLNRTDGPAVMEQLISNMFNNKHCKIIVDDIGYYSNVPYFSDDPIMQEIQYEMSNYPKRIYISAAGNDAKNMFDAEHFQSDANNYIYFWQGKEFYNSNFFSLGANDSVNIFLQWADEWGYSTNNYNLYLFDSYGNLVDSSVTVQNGMGSNPQEVIDFRNKTGRTEDYYIRIKMGGEEREIKLVVVPDANQPQITLGYTYPNYMNQTKPTRQIFGHSASQGAICVAAYESNDIDTIADYSSNGPTNLYSFTNNGNAIKEERKTPTITGTSLVHTKIGPTYFFDPFDGTSASAPHIAGIAALYFQKNSNDSRSDFLTALKQGAAPMGMIGNPGEWNSQSGFGKADAYATVGKFISVTVSQLDEQLQSFGQVGLYNNGNFSNYSVPHIFNWPENTTKTIRADQNFKPNTTEKYHDWNGLSNVINHHTFTISSNTRNITAYFKKADNISIQVNLMEGGDPGGQIHFKDPWLIDYADPNYGNNKRNQGMSAPFKQRQSPFSPDYSTSYDGDVYKGVFLNQGYNENTHLWTPPYYSVKADAQQTFSAHGQNVTGYFLNWEGTHVNFKSPNNQETPVVFQASNAEARAVYKGHLASSTVLATAYNNDRRLVRDSNGRYHLVYEDDGGIYYTYSDDNGQSWAKELLISTGDENHYPSIDVDAWNHYHVVWGYANGYSGYDIEYYNGSSGQTTTIANSSTSNAMPVITAKGILHKRVIVWQDGNALKLGLTNDDIHIWDITTIPNTNGSCIYPSIADDGSSSYATHIVWQKNDQIYYINMDFTYDVEEDEVFYSWRHDGSISSGYGSIHTHRHPCIAVSNDRKPEVTWDAYDEENEASGRAILHRKKTSTSLNNWSALTEFFDDRSSDYPSVGVYSNNSGNASLVWRYNPNDPKIYLWNRTGNSWGNIQIIGDGRYPTISSGSSTAKMVWISQTSAPYLVKSSSSGLSKSISIPLEQFRRENFDLSQIVLSSKKSSVFQGELTVTIGKMMLISKNDHTVLPFIDFPDSIINENLLRSKVFLVAPSSRLQLNFRLKVCGFHAKTIVPPEFMERPVSLFTIVDSQSKSVLVKPFQLNIGDLISNKSDTLFLSGVLDIDLGKFEGRRVYFVAKTARPDTVYPYLTQLFHPKSGLPKANEHHKIVKDKGRIDRFKLFSAYPNPFNPTTTIGYQLPKAAHVVVGIYNLQGRLVETLVDGEKAAGRYSVTWHAVNQPSGVYFYRIRAGKFTATKKLLLIK